MITHQICTLAVVTLFVAACGGSSDGGGGDSAASDASATEAADAAVDESPAADEAQEAAEDFVDDVVEDLEAVQESQGGGGATLTVNGQTWEFDQVLCAFGEDQIGQEGAVFNMSAIADGLQLYASIDDSGASHTLSINDIENFESPSVALSVSPFVVASAGTEPDFLTLNDKSVSADVVMIDDTTGEPTAEPAQFAATCP